jgi:hypothetical protein
VRLLILSFVLGLSKGASLHWAMQYRSSDLRVRPYGDVVPVSVKRLQALAQYGVASALERPPLERSRRLVPTTRPRQVRAPHVVAQELLEATEGHAATVLHLDQRDQADALVCSHAGPDANRVAGDGFGGLQEV